jgi:hypothetical protein
VPSRALATLATLILLTASAAEAKPWFTPPVGAVGSATSDCVVQNLGTQTRTVNITLYVTTGSALLSGSFDVDPGEVVSPISAGGYGNYCAFEGLSRTVRGFIAVREADTTYLVLPAGK